MPLIKLTYLNCFILLIPIFIWNIIFIPEEMLTEPPGLSSIILIAENIFRIIIFLLPLFIPLNLKDSSIRPALIIYCAGLIIYFLSWLPMLYYPESLYTRNFFIWLAPAYTPLIIFIAISFIAKSWLYASLSIIFIGIHLTHEIIRFYVKVKI